MESQQIKGNQEKYTQVMAKLFFPHFFFLFKKTVKGTPVSHCHSSLSLDAAYNSNSTHFTLNQSLYIITFICKAITLF